MPASCRELCTWLCQPQAVQTTDDLLAGVVGSHEETQNSLDPDGAFFMHWYYCIFGSILKTWHENSNSGEVTTVLAPIASLPELMVGSVPSSGHRARAYEQFRTCWVIYQQERYLFVNF